MAPAGRRRICKDRVKIEGYLSRDEYRQVKALAKQRATSMSYIVRTALIKIGIRRVDPDED